MANLSLVLDTSLQTWERDYFHALGARLGAEVHFPHTSAANSKIVARESMWILSRNWREWAEYYARPGIYFTPLGPYFGSLSVLHQVKRVFAKGELGANLVTHSTLCHRFFTEVEKRSQSQVSYLELPYLETPNALARVPVPTQGILSVGVLADFTPESNLNALVTVAHYVRRHNPQITFRIRGRGPLVKHFKEQLKELALDETVKIDEGISSMECDLLLGLQLRAEHFIGVFQAGTAGLPLIAHDTTGIEKLVKDSHTGFLVPVHDTKATGQLILRFADDLHLREQLGAKLKGSCLSLALNEERERKLRSFFQLPLSSKERAA